MTAAAPIASAADAAGSAAAASAAAPASLSHRWILSRGQDLLWFQGSVVAGLALLAVFRLAPPLDNASYSLGHPAVIALFLWGLLFDATHVWGTYARTYFAPDAASRAALPGRSSWAIIAVGPLAALADHALFPPEPSQLASAGPLFRSFLVVAYLWGYYHLVRQHYGFLMLYRRRAGEEDPRAARLDSLLLWAGCLYPYLRFSLGDAYLKSGLPSLVPAPLAADLRSALDITFAVVLAGAIALMASGRLERLRLGPKHLFLGIVIAFHGMVFGLLDNLLAITATLTIFHDLQYHRIVWQYERGLGRRPSGGLARYLGFGALLGLAWYAPRVLGVAAVQSDLARNVLLGLGWGVAFHHYYVDGRIWRVRRSKSVARALDRGARSS
jgi:hypothetical protein